MKSLLTKEQRLSLSIQGKKLEEFWRTEKPKMYKSLYEEGSLYRILKKQGDRYEEMMIDMIRDGIPPNQAEEVVNYELYEIETMEPYID